MSHVFPRVHFGGAFLYAFALRSALHGFNRAIWPLALRFLRQVRVYQAKKYALRYMVISCLQLPQYKGDKKSCTIEYVNPADTARSFTAQAQINVQGTSSAGYKKKNFKFTLKDGMTYKLREDSLPASVFCMKADVASSEGANNVELVRLYNDTVPHKTPPQEDNPQVRVGIDGVPCIIFWHDTGAGETRFWGKYNFNFDKGAENVYGLTPGCESWEFKNNTSPRVLFKSADFTGTAWQDNIEARYPEDNTDCTNLAAACACWGWSGRPRARYLCRKALQS